jgi:hypothetical protein
LLAIGAGVAALLVLVVCIVVAVLSSPIGQRAGPEIVRHPWWRAPMDEEKACRIIREIQATSANRIVRRPALHIMSNGTTMPIDDSSYMWGDRDNDPQWTLLGGGENVWIALEAGHRALSWDEARGALKRMLDRAYNSETKFRKTGVGDGQLDMLGLTPEEILRVRRAGVVDMDGMLVPTEPGKRQGR